jgi:putative ABC transport system substrate-binding protein
MQRREFIMLLGGTAAVWPLKVWAQQAPARARVGLLAFGQELEGPLFRVFRDEMRKLGHIEGQSYTLQFRSARGEPGRLQNAAAELVQIPVDVIVTDSGVASIAATKATTTVPIVMGIIGDPVELGLVASLGRPGGNVTGFAIISPQLGAKRLALLRRCAISTSSVLVSGSAGPTFTRAMSFRQRGVSTAWKQSRCHERYRSDRPACHRSSWS